MKGTRSFILSTTRGGAVGRPPHNRRPLYSRVSFILSTALLVVTLACEAREDSSFEEGSEKMQAPSEASRQTKEKPPAAEYTNRLANETSPYLLQHAHNPVNWYPWGSEALDRAKKENKPIFLSIGYSVCHWCHVMERESFEDPETAKILNEYFIAIKIDREERPDLDEIYMASVQMMTGRGGWPLSVFLTPDLKPFFGGTYFPPESLQGMPGFKTVLNRMAELWRDRRDDVTHNAEQMVRALRDFASSEPSDSGLPDRSVLARAVADLGREFDPRWGGFGGAPKFPPSGAIAVLLRQYSHTGEESLLEMATVTLDRMALGGMYDQLGGGFHRYSVDGQWLVPHFEKMLYDNALLSRVYFEAWQATGRDLYRRVAAETLDYVLRDMTDAGGGFHSAEDADSEGEEGKFYVWREDEIKALLGEEDGTLFCRYYGVSEQGNFEGRNILHVPRDPPTSPGGKDVSRKQTMTRLEPLRRKLLTEREKRVRPGKDDKVLAAWNGMMISALARGYQVTGDDRYLKAATRAADFVLAEMVSGGVLMRTYRGTGGPDDRGASKLPGYLDDYAEVAGGLIDLYEAGFDRRWLEAADELAGRMVADFWDQQDGGFFYTSADHKNLLVRTKPFHDAAVPSGNSTAILVLLRLSRLLDNRDYWSKAERGLQYMGDSIRGRPQAHLNLLCALDFHLRPITEIAVVGNPDDDDTLAMLEVIHAGFLPNKILALAEPGAVDADERLIPLLKGKTMVAGKATAYVCENFACKRPVNDPADLEAMLKGVRQ
jgi:uncharacterized protein